jgi:hypothetical protein
MSRTLVIPATKNAYFLGALLSVLGAVSGKAFVSVSDQLFKS